MEMGGKLVLPLASVGFAVVLAPRPSHLDLLGELLKLFKSDRQSSQRPRFAPFGGIRDGIAKIADISVGVDMIILFSLATVKSESKVKLETNSNPQWSLQAPGLSFRSILLLLQKVVLTWARLEQGWS